MALKPLVWELHHQYVIYVPKLCFHWNTHHQVQREKDTHACNYSEKKCSPTAFIPYWLMYVTTQEKLQFTRGNGETKSPPTKNKCKCRFEKIFQTIVKSKKLKIL